MFRRFFSPYIVSKVDFIPIYNLMFTAKVK